MKMEKQKKCAMNAKVYNTFSMLQQSMIIIIINQVQFGFDAPLNNTV